MRQHKFYPQQEPQPEELDEAMLDTTFNILRRFGVIMQPGIVPANNLYKVTGDTRFSSLGEFAMMWNQSAPPGSDDACTLDIGSGMAFSRTPISDTTASPAEPTNPVDLKLERIFISPSELTTYNATNPSKVDVLGNPLPASTGSKRILLNPLVDGLRAPSVTRYFYAAYLPVVDTATNDPSNPGNKYSIDPNTGQVSYTHWIDGYQIKGLTAASSDPNDVYLGTVVCTDQGILTPDTSARVYAYIPGAMVSSGITGSLTPPSYYVGGRSSMSDHINAIADPNLVSPTNPHGLPISGSTGGASSGPYVSSPNNFQTKGIVYSPYTTPGPYYAITATYHAINAVRLSFPAAGQALYLYGYEYNADSHYWSEVLDGGGTILELQEVVLGGSPTLQPDILAQFPAAPIRPIGNYLVYGERYIPPDPSKTGLAIKAVLVAASLSDIVSNLPTYCSPTQYPFAVCSWDGNQFTQVVDPQTGFTDANYKLVDLRPVGTIGSPQLSTNRRYYSAVDTAAHIDVFKLEHNLTVTGNEIIGGNSSIVGNAGVSGSVAVSGSIVAGATLTSGPAFSPTWVGMVVYFAKDTPRPGFLKADGSLISKIVHPEYADLVAYLGSYYGGDGINTAVLPNGCDGAFIRGIGGSAGDLGMKQPDAFQKHQHLTSASTGYNHQAAMVPSGVANSQFNPTFNYLDDGGGSPRTASETRPYNMALVPFIKY